MFPGLHPTAMMSTSGINVGFHGNANGPPRPAGPAIHPGNNMHQHHNYHHHQQHQQQQQQQQQQQSSYNGMGGGGPNSAMAAAGIGSGVKPQGPHFALAGLAANPPVIFGGAGAASQLQVTVNLYTMTIDRVDVFIQV